MLTPPPADPRPAADPAAEGRWPFASTVFFLKPPASVYAWLLLGIFLEDLPRTQPVLILQQPQPPEVDGHRLHRVLPVTEDAAT